MTEYVVKAKAFIDGRRVYPGDVVEFDGDELPGYLKEDNSREQLPKQEGFEGAGMVKKKPLPPSRHAVEVAKEYNVDLDDVKGTGSNGQILKSDVWAFINANTQAQDEVI